MVTSEPLSPDVTEPICLSPLAATTFFGFYNSTNSGLVNFQIFAGPNLSRSILSASLEKNNLTFSLLMLVALDKLVATGVRIDSSGCLFIKLVNQSSLAHEFSLHILGISISNPTAHLYAKQRSSFDDRPR